MTQLRLEGWLHHLARHAVACFLTRGDLCALGVGQRHLDRDLVDADWALNNGNWMWLSCSLLLPILSSVRSALIRQKYDKEGVYVKHYIPALRTCPPSTSTSHGSPARRTTKAGCVAGRLPRRVVDHAAASKACADKIATAYAAHKEANTATGKKRKADA